MGAGLDQNGGPMFQSKGTGSFDGARRARLVRERVRAGHGVMKRPLYRYTYTYMYVYARRETRPERRTERDKNRGRAVASHHEYEWGRATESRAKPPRRNRTGPDSRGAPVEDEGFRWGRGPSTVTGP